MPYELADKLVVAISSRALFDLDAEHRIFEGDGMSAYRSHQIGHEDERLERGTGFPLVEALLGINDRGEGALIEVVLVSRNDADTGLRVMNSVEAYELPITRAAFTDGRSPYEYLASFSCDLFLSANEADVSGALAAGFAAASVYDPPEPIGREPERVRIAFDGDAVLFAPDAERVYRRQGLAEFHRQEQQSAEVPMAAGPFKGFVDSLHAIQKRFPEDDCPIRTALVTARNAPAHKRAIKTLRTWGIRLDEAFFLGGVPKEGVLRVFRPHIFFDDQSVHCETARHSTPTARVPDRSDAEGLPTIPMNGPASARKTKPKRRKKAPAKNRSRGSQ